MFKYHWEKIKKHHYLTLVLVLALALASLAVVRQKQDFRDPEAYFYLESRQVLEGARKVEEREWAMGGSFFPEEYYEPYLAYLAQGQRLVEEALEAQGYDENGNFNKALFQPEKVRQIGQDLLALHEKYLPAEGVEDKRPMEEIDPRERGLPLNPGLLDYIKMRNEKWDPLYLGQGGSFAALVRFQSPIFFGF